MIEYTVPALMQLATYFLLSGSLFVLIYLVIYDPAIIQRFFSRLVNTYLAITMIVYLGCFFFYFDKLLKLMHVKGSDCNSNPY